MTAHHRTAATEGPRQDLVGARIVLASLADSVTCIGLRTLAAVLERQGARVDLVFLPPSARDPEVGVRRPGWFDAFVELTRGAAVVGLTVMSVDEPRAIALSRHLRGRIDGPLVWGGPQATLHPDVGARHADLVCVGDGERFLADLVAPQRSGSPPAALGPDSFAPPARPEHLDISPRVDLERTWIRDRDRIVPLTTARWTAELSRNAASRDTGTLAYETVTSRGCPHACSFCGTTALDCVRPDALYRRRSVDSVMRELREVRQNLAGLSGIGFADDNFLARPRAELERFARRYRVEVGLPFICIGSPATVDAERLEVLADAGLRRLKMGIQSGSARTNEVLGREQLGRHLPRALEAIAGIAERCLPPRFDLLVDLPFETLEDRLETLELVARLPRPFRLELNSLRLMDGTPLDALAREQGWCTPRVTRDFKEIEPSYTNALLALCRNDRLPPAILHVLARPGVARSMSRGVPALALGTAWRAARIARRRARWPR